MTHPGRVIFVAGGELTLFMPEIIPGKSVTARLTHLKADPALLGNGKLDAYLATLVPRLRARFDGRAIDTVAPPGKPHEVPRARFHFRDGQWAHPAKS